MNTVEPIRDMGTVLDIADYLKLRKTRDYVMFMFGVYSGLRISDILMFRVRDVRNKDFISIREKKTGNEKKFPINKDLKEILNTYIAPKKDFEYLFKTPNQPNKPITRQQAYNILSNAANQFGIEAVGTHTLRKTFGYHMYKQTNDAALLMDIFGHSDINYTLRYIGINQDCKNKAYNGLSFKR
ncbi:site-specific integrase [Lachnotalea glycerini]|uniref:Site-specific integrase n=1 Tax=Lachnotalea glycerini TaxID=1763509 RepID=A0A371JC42_9FIRM|nr:site-specific integrase [Lachnotalea glycerini]RDY30303.1 site-specific integrase [Lachnotalea glycerini]